MGELRNLSSVVAVTFALVMAVQCRVAAAAVNNSQPSPILLIHGITGSQLDARVENAPNFFCNTGGEYRSLWLSLTQLLINCLDHGLKLNYNSSTNTYTPNDGVTIRVGGAAGSDVTKAEYLDPLKLVPYFHDMVDYFVARGYQRDVSIRAAPYDWRFAADKLEELGYYNELKALVEEMYTANNMTRVTLVVHSMGGPVSLYFLNNIVNQAWKDTYIHAYVPVAAAWDGGVAALENVISGVTDGTEFLIRSDLWERVRDTIRSFQSVFWLLPSALIFGNDTVFVTVGSVQYTANDFEALFQRIGFPDGYAMYTGVAPLVDGWRAPNVPTYCYYGLRGAGSTPVAFTYAVSGFPDSAPISRSMGNGDGTVNREISEICLRWETEQSSPFNSSTFDADHVGILSDEELLAAIGQVVGAQENGTITAIASIFSFILAAMLAYMLS